MAHTQVKPPPELNEDNLGSYYELLCNNDSKIYRHTKSDLNHLSEDAEVTRKE